MQSIVIQIRQALEDPEELERLYRQDSASFRAAIHEVSRMAPDSPTVRVWLARLEYKEPGDDSENQWIWYAAVIGLCFGLLVRLPALWLGAEWYYPRMAPSLVILSLAAYFWLPQRDQRLLIAGISLTVLAAGYTSFLPSHGDSVMMALIFLPVLFLAFLASVFAGPAWRETAPRIRFIQFNGELLVLSSLVGLGGIVFSGLTIALFEIAFPNSGQWYAENIGVIGASAVPVGATYLYDAVFKRRTRIAPALARVFAPLFLIMTSIYLVFSLVAGQNPFVDRSFLITVNGLLLVVLGMTVFSIVERGENSKVAWIDYVNVGLLAVTLIIDLLALSAILFRLTSYGFTPNRVVVLGTNLVVMTHLLWTCTASLGLIRSKGPTVKASHAVASYLPVYIVWAALVVFVLPFAFGFS